MTLPQIGDVLGGKFRVERVLGTGGMGVVLAAFHLQLEQMVALKLLQADAAKQKEVVARFAREARAAARIESVHVARVLDVGTLENGAPYMVMEYLHGEDLEGLLRKKGRLPIVEVVGYVLQACEAISEAHSMGIVHRDLKPANLFLAERTDGRRLIKVLDFGISKVVSEGAQMGDASLTKTSAVMGSPMYMSPEQLRSARDVDARADIWALGVTLYELFCGKGPFSTGTVPEVCAAILKDQPRPPREIRTDLPEPVQAAVLRCLEKEPSKRFANVAELALALMSYAPPGSERSIERISRVLQRSVRSPRSGAETPANAPPSAEPPEHRSRESLELALTTPSTSDVALAGMLAETKVERKVEPRANPTDPGTTGGAISIPTDPGNTASATSISSWDGKQMKAARRGRSPAALVATGVVLLLVIGGTVMALTNKGDEQKQAGDPAPPSEATAPALAPPPVQTEGPAIAEPATASPEPSESAAPSAAPSATAPPPVDPRRRMPWPKPRGGGSAAPSAEPSSAPSAAPSSAASAAPSSAVTSKATAAPTTKP